MGRVCSLVAALVLLGAGSVQSGAGYTLNWWTVDGGGVTHDPHGTYVLGATMGQPDAARLSGGGYRLNGGFWHGGTAVYYLPLIVKGSGAH